MSSLSRRDLLRQIAALCGVSVTASFAWPPGREATDRVADQPADLPAEVAAPTTVRTEGTSPATPDVVARTSTPRPSPHRPNVLLITVDTLRADRLGSYGLASALTPTIDGLAAEGVRFSLAISQRPQTNPAHACLFTGLYPSTNGLKWHMVDKLRSGSQTLAGVFADNGYHTAARYSWVSLDPQFCGLNQGFADYQGFVVNRTGVFANQQAEDLAHVYRQLTSTVPIMRTVDGALGASDKYEDAMDGRADITTAAGMAWLDAYAGSDPFLLWLHYYDPHYPYTPPAPYDHILHLRYDGKIDGSMQTIRALKNNALSVDEADRARLYELYQGEIAFADSEIGRFLKQLSERGLLDETIVALVGDHGESFGEHGDWTHGEQPWSNEIEVPLVLRYPPSLPAGAVVDTPVQLIDVMPTLLELAGLQAPQPVQGSSLLPLVIGRSAGVTSAFVELADRDLVSVVTANWALIRKISSNELQLYNLLNDSDEQRNLAQSERLTAARLDAQLTTLMKVSGVTR